MKTLHLMVLLLGTVQNSRFLARETSIVITKYLLKVTGLSHGLRLCVQSRAACWGSGREHEVGLSPLRGLCSK